MGRPLAVRHFCLQVRFDVSPGSQARAADLSPPQRDGPAISTVTASGAHPQPRDSTAALFGRQEPQAPSKSAKYKAPKGDQDKIRKRHQEKQAVRETPLDCQPGVLAEGPELNTTLAVGVELRGVAEAEFDPKRAVQDQLRKSAHRKNAIEIRATEGVNIPRSQQLYRALVSVSVPEDELISEAVKERLLLAPPPRAHGNKESPPEGPDLLHFYSPSELLRETPFLPGEGVTLPRPRPVPRPSQATFDLYHKHRQWEA
ncbi:PPR35 phosphatase, partial [Atractosteus spatula]|nr:PPR35 phosphatase [Atractosteus spatula]